MRCLTVKWNRSNLFYFRSNELNSGPFSNADSPTNLSVPGEHEIVRILQIAFEMYGRICWVLQSNCQGHWHFNIHFFIQVTVNVQRSFNNFCGKTREKKNDNFSFYNTFKSNKYSFAINFLTHRHNWPVILFRFRLFRRFDAIAHSKRPSLVLWFVWSMLQSPY